MAPSPDFLFFTSCYNRAMMYEMFATELKHCFQGQTSIDLKLFFQMKLCTGMFTCRWILFSFQNGNTANLILNLLQKLKGDVVSLQEQVNHASANLPQRLPNKAMPPPSYIPPTRSVPVLSWEATCNLSLYVLLYIIFFCNIKSTDVKWYTWCDCLHFNLSQRHKPGHTDVPCTRFVSL